MFGDENTVKPQKHINRSQHTTTWLLLRLKQPDGIDAALAKLRNLGCDSVGLDAARSHAVDVPEVISWRVADSILATLNTDAVAVAFPPMWHLD